MCGSPQPSYSGMVFNTAVNLFVVIYTANDGSGQRQLSAFPNTEMRDVFKSYLKVTLAGYPPDGTTTDWWVLANSAAVSNAHNEAQALGGTSYSIQRECSKKSPVLVTNIM